MDGDRRGAHSSVMLTDFLDGESRDDLMGTMGLGISMGRSEEPPHMQVDMSRLSEEQTSASENNAMGLGLDLGLQAMNNDDTFVPADGTQIVTLAPPSEDKDAALATSPSFVSSLEGFAINVTHPGEQQITIHSPGLEGETGQQEKRNTGSKGRWSSKLWSMASKSPFGSLRSPARSSRLEEEQVSSLRALTLVDRKVGEDGRDYHSRSRDDGYRSMPSSAALPGTATFASLQAPAPALYSEPRSSRHTKQISRLRYHSQQVDHIQVDMNSPPTIHLSADGLVSPRVAADYHASLLTPKMEYVEKTKKNRHSWSHSTTFDRSSADADAAAAASSATPTVTTAPFWLEPKRESVTFQRESVFFANVRNSTLSALEPQNTEDAAGKDQHMDAILGDGIRRRGNHRATNSVPSTPSILPDAWVRPTWDQGYYDEAAATYNRRQTGGVQFLDQTNLQVRHPTHQQEASKRLQYRRSSRNILSTISVLGPASAVIAPYLVNLTGPRNRDTVRRSTLPKGMVNSRANNRLSIFTDNRGGPEGFFAYSGRALENTSPSRALFFAGFLAMPWLWFIGGWGLDSDGSIYVEKDIYYTKADEDAVLLQLLQKEPVGSQLVQASGRTIYHQSTISSHRGPVRTMLQERLDEYDAEQYRYSMGQPESIINMEEQEEGDDEEPREAAAAAGRLHSIDLQGSGEGELEDYQSGVAYSTEGNEVVYSPSQQHIARRSVAYPPGGGSGAYAVPISQWDQYEDEKTAKELQQQPNPSFLQRAIQVNSALLAKLTSNSHSKKSDSKIAASRASSDSYSLSSAMRNEQDYHRQENMALDDSNSNLQMMRKKKSAAPLLNLSSWSHLETFVLWNRIMAFLVSIIVFGGFAVAIFAVINDW
jgi:hypothetical protein